MAESIKVFLTSAQKNKMIKGGTFQMSSAQLSAGHGKHGVEIQMSPKNVRQLKSNASRNKGFRFSNLDRNFKLFLYLSGIFALGSFSYSFLLVFANKSGFSAAYLPVLYLILTFASSLASLPFGRYSDRLKSRKKLLFLSYILWFLVCGILVYSQSKAAIIVALVLYGIHKGGITVVQKALVSDLCAAEVRATSLGAFQLVIGLCALPASLVAGLLWVAVNPLIPFFLSLVLTTISGAMLFFVKENFSGAM